MARRHSRDLQLDASFLLHRGPDGSHRIPPKRNADAPTRCPQPIRTRFDNPFDTLLLVSNTPVETRLVEVNAENWRQVVDVTPRPEQDRYVAPVARYLCLAHYGGEWQPLAIQVEGSIVGHIMWATDEKGSVWLGGLVIDASQQGRGIGTSAVVSFIDRFADKGYTNLALSYSPENVVARRLYAKLGFVETGEVEDDEIVARFQRTASSKSEPSPRS